MAKVNILFSLFLAFGLLVWAALYNFGGYTSQNAIITARSASIKSTMDGEVVAVQAKVGEKVAPGSPLISIHNDRIDQSSLSELNSKRQFLRVEILRTEVIVTELEEKKRFFDEKATSYQSWLENDLYARRLETQYELQSIQESFVEGNAAVKENKVKELEAKLARVDLRIASIGSSGVLQDDGDASYWEKAADDIEMRIFDFREKLGSMRSELVQALSHLKAEEARIGRILDEEHTAPFHGMINAVLASKGERVNAGTNLVEVLDCASPIAIVPIPDNRFGDFYIGQKATIEPLASDEVIIGSVQHIISSALISRDTSIATPLAETDGNRMIIAFQHVDDSSASSGSCDTARPAWVTIDTEQTFISSVFASLLKPLQNLVWSKSNSDWAKTTTDEPA